MAPLTPMAPRHLCNRKPRRAFVRSRRRSSGMVLGRRYGGHVDQRFTTAMGIMPSLYAAFGDKERLFLEAVRRCHEGVTAGVTKPSRMRRSHRARRVQKLMTYMAEDLSSSTHRAAACADDGGGDCEQCLGGMRRHWRNGSGPGARGHEGADQAEHRGRRCSARHRCRRAERFLRDDHQRDVLMARDGATRKSLLGTAERAMLVFPPAATVAAK